MRDDTDQILLKILDRLDAIERELVNPGKRISDKEKISEMSKAILSGDRGRIKAAKRLFTERT